MEFTNLEVLIGENIPECVKKILVFCGYNTISSLKNISVKNVEEIEDFVNKGSSGRELIKSFDCCYKKTYSEQTEFHFLPGHKSVVLALPEIAHQYSQQKRFEIPSHFPFILRELIETAENNKDKFRPMYSDAIKSIGTFLFLKCGRSSYEFLSKNLPLPSINLIRKFVSVFFSYR